jgi:hypothetical protein
MVGEEEHRPTSSTTYSRRTWRSPTRNLSSMLRNKKDMSDEREDVTTRKLMIPKNRPLAFKMHQTMQNLPVHMLNQKHLEKECY